MWSFQWIVLQGSYYELFLGWKYVQRLGRLPLTLAWHLLLQPLWDCWTGPWPCRKCHQLDGWKDYRKGNKSSLNWNETSSHVFASAQQCHWIIMIFIKVIFPGTIFSMRYKFDILFSFAFNSGNCKYIFFGTLLMSHMIGKNLLMAFFVVAWKKYNVKINS